MPVQRVVLLLLVMVLLPVTGYGATTAVTLQEAIARALERNHQLKAGEYARAAAGAGVDVSTSRYFPRIGFEESFSASSAPSRVFMMKLDQGRISANDFTPEAMNSPASRTDFRTALTLEQPLFDASIARGVTVAKEQDASAAWQLARLREETAFQVFLAYVQVQRAKLHLAVSNQAVQAAREHERLAGARSGAGVGLKADELRARSALSEMQQQSISALNTLELAKLELARLLGEAPGAKLDIAEAIVPRSLDLGEQPAIDLALATRQDLRAMEHRLARAAGETALARGSYLPTLHAAAGYELHDRTVPLGRDNDGWSVGANLRWEVFDGMRRSRTVEQASLLQRAQEAELADFRNLIALQVKEAMMRRDESGKRLEVARHDALAAEEAVRLTQKRYENSLSLLVELLDAQTNLNRSRAQLVDQEVNHALAGALVRHRIGIFLKETGP
jgi:outer membrane protein TolC